MENKDKEVFSYTYSAEQQKEVERIRKKYIDESSEETDKMERLKRLDASVTQKGSVVALIIGILGCLIMGVGMCFAMMWSEVGDIMFIVGIIIGLVGIVLVCVAYPIYSAITKKERERIAPEILRLTDELLK